MVVRLLASRCVAVIAMATAVASAGSQPVVLEGVRGLDQHGRQLRAHRLAGHPVLLHFVFTGCSSSCPTQLAELAEVHRALPAATRSKLRFVSVTVDPLTDTPQVLAAHARRFGADREGWIFVTGKPGDLEPLYERMRVFDPGKPAAQPEDHRTSLYLYGADGRLLQRFRGVPIDRSRLVAELTRL